MDTKPKSTPEFELLTALEDADPRDAPDTADRLADELSAELDGESPTMPIVATVPGDLD